MRPADTTAAALMDIAERLSRLPAHDRRNPHAFTEGKSELSAELRAIAQTMTGRVDPVPFRPRRRIQVSYMVVEGRRIMVQKPRASFGV